MQLSLDGPTTTPCFSLCSFDDTIATSPSPSLCLQFLLSAVKPIILRTNPFTHQFSASVNATVSRPQQYKYSLCKSTTSHRINRFFLDATPANFLPCVLLSGYLMHDLSLRIDTPSNEKRKSFHRTPSCRRCAPSNCCADLYVFIINSISHEDRPLCCPRLVSVHQSSHPYQTCCCSRCCEVRAPTHAPLTRVNS